MKRVSLLALVFIAGLAIDASAQTRSNTNKSKRTLGQDTVASSPALGRGRADTLGLPDAAKGTGIISPGNGTGTFADTIGRNPDLLGTGGNWNQGTRRSGTLNNGNSRNRNLGDGTLNKGNRRRSGTSGMRTGSGNTGTAGSGSGNPDTNTTTPKP